MAERGRGTWSAAAASAFRGQQALKLVAAAAVALAVSAASPAHAQAYVVDGRCRDGQANGAYTVKSPEGRLRVSGAFAKGRRTGTFLFWAENGLRIAVIPYEDGAKSGTVATWYAESAPRGELRRKLEARYVGDVLDGITRSWHANGRRRGEYRYERGELAEANAWDESGARLEEGEARRTAAADRVAAEKSYSSLEQFVAQHPPQCV